MLFLSCTVWIRSSPLSTSWVALSTTHLETNAPVEPCARTMPLVFGSSWFKRTVNVPSPLSNAPSPSGIPAMR